MLTVVAIRHAADSARKYIRHTLDKDGVARDLNQRQKTSSHKRRNKVYRRRSRPVYWTYGERSADNSVHGRAARQLGAQLINAARFSCYGIVYVDIHSTTRIGVHSTVATSLRHVRRRPTTH